MDMTLRYTKILLLLMVGLFGLVAAIQNFVQMDSDLALVGQVVSGGGAMGVAPWQQIEAPWLVTLCWLLIPLAKLASAALCLVGVATMWRERRGSGQAFQVSKRAGLAGCGIMLAMLFGIFILVAETWFQQWQTELGAAILGAAERYIVAITAVALFVYLPDGEFTGRSTNPG
ncbi:DUF2165 domain-containing protein [Pseudohalioglobus sediminis]|uniref:DUF2165 domain-containing protein n=1 Tax=Pseudohalioglobus sediminis TaxID=2606449 RepID=A0A5B0WXV6_9GAMM|nr:DUF2165 family protein [Pseudohalioglobus sediminis]KAA1191856.1 DUF2165 domain-containing protein [Pseudohalioglobus sediminis]